MKDCFVANFILRRQWNRTWNLTAVIAIKPPFKQAILLNNSLRHHPDGSKKENAQATTNFSSIWNVASDVQQSHTSFIHASQTHINVFPLPEVLDHQNLIQSPPSKQPVLSTFALSINSLKWPYSSKPSKNHVKSKKTTNELSMASLKPYPPPLCLKVD